MGKKIMDKDVEAIENLPKLFNIIKREIAKTIVGQSDVIDQLLISLFARGHCLLIGVPGLAKTLLVKTLGEIMDLKFSRIQFTPDLMPSDITGTEIIEENVSSGKKVFKYIRGPIFANIILADEINRAPAKVQSALLEAMEEKQVTVGQSSYVLPELFMVVATQNPIEHEGTYKLPEAQLDRFLFKLNLNYLNKEDEIEILNRHNQNNHLADVSSLKPEISTQDILDFRSKIQDVHIEKNLIEYIAEIVEETRRNKSIYLGASPRAGIAMLNGSKAYAALKGRDFVTPDDIKYIAEPVLNHRIMLTPEAEMEGNNVMNVCNKIIEKIEVPR